MGELPSLRVAQNTPFVISGVDFFGPFQVKHHRWCRYTTTYYVALFVCFSTKAVHLEVVPNCTTEAFINALMRFIGDRGRVKKVVSDNAQNFEGTGNHLRRVQNQLRKYSGQIADACQQHGVEFSNIPPRTPEHGGFGKHR